MNSQPKSTIMMMAVLVASSLAAGCDHRPRIGAANDVPRTIRAVDDSRTIDRMSRGPSIVRETIDTRCFGHPQDGNTEVIACPREVQLAIAAE